MNYSLAMQMHNTAFAVDLFLMEYSVIMTTSGYCHWENSTSRALLSVNSAVQAQFLRQGSTSDVIPNATHFWSNARELGAQCPAIAHCLAPEGQHGLVGTEPDVYVCIGKFKTGSGPAQFLVDPWE